MEIFLPFGIEDTASRSDADPQGCDDSRDGPRDIDRRKSRIARRLSDEQAVHYAVHAWHGKRDHRRKSLFYDSSEHDVGFPFSPVLADISDYSGGVLRNLQENVKLT